jgi:hypothetical protein
MRREIVTWNEVDRLIDHLVDQFEHEFEAMVMTTRGGIIPGGLLAEALNITHILTAAVDFPAQMDRGQEKLLVWPQFIQFPEEDLLIGRRVGFGADNYSGEKPRLCFRRYAIYLRAAFQPRPESVRYPQAGLFCGAHGRFHRLPMGNRSRPGPGAAGLLEKVYLYHSHTQSKIFNHKDTKAQSQAFSLRMENGLLWN